MFVHAGTCFPSSMLPASVFDTLWMIPVSIEKIVTVWFVKIVTAITSFHLKHFQKHFHPQIPSVHDCEVHLQEKEGIITKEKSELNHG